MCTLLWFVHFLTAPIFLASSVPVLLIWLYQWSNLAATAWVYVARRVVPLSCPAVAVINPQIEQSLCWPLQTQKSQSVHTFHRESLCKTQAFFLWWWCVGHIKTDECVHVWKSESVCGHGGFSVHEMDREEGLRWLSLSLSISNSTLLWENALHWSDLLFMALILTIDRIMTLF